MYQWQINGTNKGTDNPVFTLDADAAGKLTTTDVIRCIVTNSNSGESGISNLISSIVVLQLPVSKVNLYYNYNIIVPEITICQGTPVRFNFSFTFGNTYLLDPAFSYKAYYQLNGVDLLFNTAIQDIDLSPYLKDGDIVTLRFDYNSKCYVGSAVSENQTIVHVISSATPSVTISSENSSICAGSLVKFIASAINAGKTPSYQWLLNGQNAGTNDSTFTSSALKTGDQLQCKVISSNIYA